MCSAKAVKIPLAKIEPLDPRCYVFLLKWNKNWMEASTTYLVAESSRLKKPNLPSAKSYTGLHHLKISNGNGKLLVNSFSVVCRTSEGSSTTISFSGFSVA